VCWHKPSSKYTASITIEKKNVHLGYFTNEVEAAQRYDEKAGPLGRKVNFPETAPAPELRGDFLKKSLVADQHDRRCEFRCLLFSFLSMTFLPISSTPPPPHTFLFGVTLTQACALFFSSFVSKRPCLHGTPPS
jgi:hypothetical protein